MGLVIFRPTLPDRTLALSAPEIRIDQLAGLPTILAPGRADRPHGFERADGDEEGAENCPFCEGREEKTPPEVYAVRPDGGEPDTPGWTSRVVPNLYPALADPSRGSLITQGAKKEPRDEGNESSATGSQAGAFASSGDPLLESRRAGEPDLFAFRPAVGSHEVVVNAPEHATAMAELSEERFLGAIATWRERMRAHSDAAYVQLVVNEGAGAGASLPHTHAQLYALQFVPAAVARERERAGAYRERTAGGSLLSDVLVEEVRRRERLVAIDDEAALICPWASRSPYELRVVPRREAARFEDDTTGGAMLRTAMQVLAARFDGPPELNLWVATAPPGADSFHWHVDIAPRLTTKAGFELGTGVDINIYPPERAAADLQECL
jgi:UDPglucose--hexose-1-phosphate uridylyltransferase